ncbi:MAG: SpoIID/LytB domain-containing protein [Actinomycetes bacterium]|jgi:SpoIID/LytB domain protein
MSKAFLALLFVFSTLIPTAHAAEVPTVFSFQGSGYGHGVGLSQMGARSMALAGQNSEQILKYFYKDIAIEPKDDSKILRVNIGHLLSSAKITSTLKGSQLQIIQGDMGSENVIPVFTLADSITFSIIGSTVSPRLTIGKTAQVLTRSKTFTIRWSGTRYLDGPDTIISVTHSGLTQKYRYGQIQVKAVKSPTGYRIEMTNSVRLADEYLWGVSEMPSFWPVAALEAQAIASRTYALSKAGIYRSACDCDLYGEISDQTFLGYAKEIEKKYGVVWKEVVTRTTGLTITQAGLPITAYFFSSSGGKTELAVNAWGSTKAYTQIVDDPGSLDLTLNPRFVTWNREVPQSIIAAAFLLPDVVSLEILGVNESGTVAQIQATSSTGVKVVLRGETFRSRTKIPSAWFSLVSVQN